MDKNRFLNYARYDLTIHQAFYRNMALLSAVIMLSITLLGFLARWWQKSHLDVWTNDDTNYTHIFFTVISLSAVMSLLMSVYAACFNHPLANRQDRLKTLTLPATNSEKFLWHTLLVVVGGAALLTVTLLLCDALNAVFSLLTGFDHVYSLTAGVGSLITCTLYEGMGAANDILGEVAVMREDAFRLWLSIFMMSTLSFVWTISAFVYGNCLKFRYNILWTILVLWVLQTVLVIVLIVVVTFMQEGYIMPSVDADWARDEVYDFIAACVWGINVVLIATAALMWWRSWVRYCRVQITSPLNR